MKTEMDAMEYKGYRGVVHYSAEDRILHGRILGIDDVVSFEGADVDELEKAFHEAVDDYLTLCEKLGRMPDREYSGRIPLRIDGALHRRVAIAAHSEGSSVNSWIADALEAATKIHRSDAATKRVAAKKPSAFRARRPRSRVSKPAAMKPTSSKKRRAAVREATR
jgi:predicted HicB family RNase H-like nuclease